MNLLIGQGFSVEKLIVEVFISTDLHLEIVILKPNISIDESLTRHSDHKVCIGCFVDRVFNLILPFIDIRNAWQSCKDQFFFFLTKSRPHNSRRARVLLTLLLAEICSQCRLQHFGVL